MLIDEAAIDPYLYLDALLGLDNLDYSSKSPQILQRCTKGGEKRYELTYLRKQLQGDAEFGKLVQLRQHVRAERRVLRQ